MVTSTLKKLLLKCIGRDFFVNSYCIKHIEINFSYPQTIQSFSPVFETSQQKLDETYTEGNIEFQWENFISALNFIILVYLSYSSAYPGMETKTS